MRSVVRVVWAAAAMGLTAVSAAPPAHADVLVTIDKSSQRMSVSVDGQPRYLWRVSTGRPGYGTPSGTFHPQWMARTYFSRKYYDSPMPYSIFFHGGFAIHGTMDIHRLGGPASHGCVRLDPRNAATLFALVQEQGMRRTRIVIANTGHLQSPWFWSGRESGEAQAIKKRTERLLQTQKAEGRTVLARARQLHAAAATKRAHDAAVKPVHQIATAKPSIKHRLVTRTQIAAREPAVAIGVRAAKRSALPAHIEIVTASSGPLSAAPRIIHVGAPLPTRPAPASRESAPRVR